MICRGCELEISGTLLTVDLRIMDMSEFDVILGMDWLTAYRVIIDCERRRVTAYTQDGTRVVFRGGGGGGGGASTIICPIQYMSPSVRDSGGLASGPYPRGRGETRLGSTSSNVQVSGCFSR